MSDKITTIPYRDASKGQEMNLLLVKPTERQSRITESGLEIAAEVGHDFEEGKVVAVGDLSLFSVGDTVTYKKLDRSKKDLYESVHFNGEDFDVIGESEVWSVNDFPYNRIFVQPYAEPERSASGLILSTKMEGITQKGRIASAPPNSAFKTGSEVEYRRNTVGQYYNATIDGVESEVLYEPDIHLVNGKVSPFKIIVKINLAEQKQKRETTESGLILSPLYQYMLYNLQYGEVVEVGEKAAEFYPGVSEGDTVILHHFVESEEYRLIKREQGNHAPIYEYRVINCLDKGHREIFGRLLRKKAFSSGANVWTTKVEPVNQNIFLKWDIELFHKRDKSLSLVDLPGFDDCENLLDLKAEIESRKAAGVNEYKSKMGGYIADINRYDGTTESGQREVEKIHTKIANLRRDQEKAAAYVNANHLVICDQLWPKNSAFRVVCTYKQLYAINILGNKWLIADKDFIFLNIDDMNQLHATGEKVLVKPVIEKSESPLFIPDAAREVPQKGVVISIGHKVDDPHIKEGFTVLYRKGAGMPLKWEDEDYFIMKEGDVIGHVELPYGPVTEMIPAGNLISAHEPRSLA